MPECSFSSRKERRDVRFLRQIAALNSPMAGATGESAFGPLALAVIMRDDACSLGQECRGNFAADSTGNAGDQNYLIFETSFHESQFPSVLLTSKFV
jgi:hypothetical protein